MICSEIEVFYLKKQATSHKNINKKIERNVT